LDFELQTGQQPNYERTIIRGRASGSHKERVKKL
jgi:hypothetical protein